MNINVFKVENTFFGSNVTVAGLITGYDYLRSLGGKALGDVLYIPACSLRAGEDMFLDSMCLEELEKSLGVRIIPLPNDGSKFVRALLGE